MSDSSVQVELPHIPVLRQGKAYTSLEKTEITRLGSEEKLVEISQANAGLIRRDFRKIHKAYSVLQEIPSADLLKMSKEAGEIFMNGEVSMFEGGKPQGPQDYMDSLSATSGLPYALIKRNMAKIYQVFTEMEQILAGLTRGMDLSIIDNGYGQQGGVNVSFFPVTQALGVVLPSNSPGVNSLWMPSLVLKVPVILKPGREEPWTPLRIIHSFIKAGFPPEAFSFYPTSHEGSGTIMDICDRALIFGDVSTVEKYAGNPGVQVHGPGWSKVIIGDDEIENWEKYIDIIVESVVANGGRSCINASAVVVPKYAKEISEAVAKKFADIKATSEDDPNATLSAFANPKMADYIDAMIDDGLETAGAQELSANYRDCQRRVEVDGRSLMLPTIVYCDSVEHPLFNKEFLFPFVTVAEVPQSDVLDKIGDSLVVSAITHDEKFIRDLLSCSHIDRLNLGPVPTNHVEWDQPHEGNLFEFLYRRRSIQRSQS